MRSLHGVELERGERLCYYGVCGNLAPAPLLLSYIDLFALLVQAIRLYTELIRREHTVCYDLEPAYQSIYPLRYRIDGQSIVCRIPAERCHKAEL